MPDDNSPQLGGLPKDNAPMISGRGTKIIADARGAYEVRNLNGLLPYLNADQTVTLRRMIAEHWRDAAVSHLEQLRLPPPVSLAAVDQWLSSPTEENRERIEELIAHESHLYPTQGLAQFIINDDPPKPGELALFLVKTEALQYSMLPSLVQYLEDWYIETAWALLIGKPLPPFEADQETIDALTANIAFWYQKKDPFMLYWSLNEAQEQRLKQALLPVALWYVHLIPLAQWPERYRAWIESSRRWLAEPSTLDYEQNRSMLKLLEKRSKIDHRLQKLMIGLIRLFDENIPRGYPFWDSNDATKVVVIAETVRLVVKSLPHRHEHQWVSEIEWAILHDQDLPTPTPGGSL